MKTQMETKRLYRTAFALLRRANEIIEKVNLAHKNLLKKAA